MNSSYPQLTDLIARKVPVTLIIPFDVNREKHIRIDHLLQGGAEGPAKLANYTVSITLARKISFKINNVKSIITINIHQKL